MINNTTRLIVLMLLVFLCLTLLPLPVYCVYQFINQAVSNYILIIMECCMCSFAICLCILGVTVKISPNSRIDTTNEHKGNNDVSKSNLKITRLDSFIYALCAVRQTDYTKQKTDAHKNYYYQECPVLVKQGIPNIIPIHIFPLITIMCKSIIKRLATKCKQYQRHLPYCGCLYGPYSCLSWGMGRYPSGMAQEHHYP
jgi:hypothetical protein